MKVLLGCKLAIYDMKFKTKMFKKLLLIIVLCLPPNISPATATYRWVSLKTYTIGKPLGGQLYKYCRFMPCGSMDCKITG
jgi:hypothetical protein